MIMLRLSKGGEIMDTLKEARKEKNISQIDLAAKLGVSVYTVQLWERGVSTPNEENQRKLEEFFKEAK